MLTRRSSRWSTALSAGLLFVTLLGCKKVKQLVSGKQESKCASFSACESACNGSDTLACIKLGDMHRTEAHGSLGKWDPEAAKAAYDKSNPTLRGRLRDVTRVGRDRVIRLRLHQRPMLGRLLRRLDRHLP